MAEARGLAAQFLPREPYENGVKTQVHRSAPGCIFVAKMGQPASKLASAAASDSSVRLLYDPPTTAHEQSIATKERLLSRAVISNVI